MIALSRLNGRTVAINPDLIVWIDITPDTTLCLAGGERIVVRESLDDVVQRIVAYRRLVGQTTAISAEFSRTASRGVKASERAPARASIRAVPSAEITPARTSIRATQPVITRK